MISTSGSRSEGSEIDSEARVFPPARTCGISHRGAVSPWAPYGPIAELVLGLRDGDRTASAGWTRFQRGWLPRVRIAACAWWPVSAPEAQPAKQRIQQAEHAHSSSQNRAPRASRFTGSRRPTDQGTDLRSGPRAVPSPVPHHRPGPRTPRCPRGRESRAPATPKSPAGDPPSANSRSLPGREATAPGRSTPRRRREDRDQLGVRSRFGSGETVNGVHVAAGTHHDVPRKPFSHFGQNMSPGHAFRRAIIA